MSDRFRFRAWDETRQKMDFNGFVNVKTGKHEDWRSIYGEDGTYETEDIIMQCTGLKDKNGKLIYEGDIVKIDGNEFYNNAIVAWNARCAYFEYEVYYNNQWGFDSMFPCDTVDEIIGNIYQDGGLLE